MDQKFTIVDIAREAGVSVATVSRVINGTAPVAEATRQRVNDVILRHHFAPSAVARSLVSRQSMTIGITMPDISNPYFAAMFGEFEKQAALAGYAVLLCNTGFYSGAASPKAAQEAAYFQMMLEKKVDGALIVGGQADLMQPTPEYRAALALLASVIPTLVLGSAIDGVNCQFVQREDGLGVQKAMRYLHELGHRRVAFVGGERGVTITEKRLEAYLAMRESLHMDADDSLIATTDYYTPDGYRAVMQLHERRARHTAMLCMNDRVAFGAYRAMHELGVNVPKDVSVISCDQFLTADYYVPSLTSVDQHDELFAQSVIKKLLSAMAGQQDTAPVEGQCELIKRESCAPVN